MAEFTFFTNPMSRGQISRWALHEAGADYEAVEFSDWANKPPELARYNPMNKVPTLVHHDDGNDHVITEAAAINHYLAETHPDAGLLPATHERAAYFRWLFFAAGPLEQAIVAKSMGWEVAEDRSAMAGFGSYDLTLDTVEGWLKQNDFAAGSRFTMADTYLGSHIAWGLQFGSIEERPVFKFYAERCQERPKFHEAAAIDHALIEAAQS